jgi:hypothetical protein
MEKKYYISDTLQKQIDWENIMKMSRYAGGHDSQMRGLFKNATVMAHWNEGDYQGKVATLVMLEDGRYALYNDYYGSCSGCDSWEDASDEEVKTMCVGLANGAYIFESFLDVLEFLMDEEKEGSWSSWDDCKHGILTEFKQKHDFTQSSQENE